MQKWTRGGVESKFNAQDLTLYTHTNVHTRDILRIWSYGMGDNSFGTLHFLLADGTAYTLAVQTDGDLTINNDIMSVLPESASADTRKVLAGVLKWYNAIERGRGFEYDEHPREYARLLALAALGDDFCDALKQRAPSCDPGTWKDIVQRDGSKSDEVDAAELFTDA